MEIIRCGSNRPSPYLRKYLPTIPRTEKSLAIDLGAGNLRNTNFARSLGWKVFPIDKAGDFGSFKIDIGKELLPFGDVSVDLFLCNYVMCFLNEEERKHLISEINRVAKFEAHLIVEMFPAKKGFLYDINELVGFLNWKVIKMSKDRFVAQK